SFRASTKWKKGGDAASQAGAGGALASRSSLSAPSPPLAEHERQIIEFCINFVQNSGGSSAISSLAAQVSNSALFFFFSSSSSLPFPFHFRHLSFSSSSFPSSPPLSPLLLSPPPPSSSSSLLFLLSPPLSSPFPPSHAAR